MAIAAWRLLLASLLLGLLAGRRLTALVGLGRGERALLLLTGAALAAHFFTWIAAVQLTTVANAAIFFSINPVITTAAAWFFFGERVGPRLVLSILLGLAGVVVIGLDDLSLSSGSLAGDGMALLCSLLFTVYFLAGRRLRRRLDNRVYVTAIYGTAAAISFATLFVLRLPVVAYSGRTWLCFVLMALIPTGLGHTSLNHALRYISPARISTATLTEPLLAGAVAWLAWGEAITPAVAAGYGLICLSVAVLVAERWSLPPAARDGRIEVGP